MNDLKPCPFCGEVPRHYTMLSAGYGEVKCLNCATIFTFMLPETLGEVKEAWNRRADDA